MTRPGISSEILTCPHCYIDFRTTDPRGECPNCGDFAKEPDMSNEATTTFQERVTAWLFKCFNQQIATNIEERADRFIEEAFELVQSNGYNPDRVAVLRDYVWSRKIGDPAQEVGGVMVTLACYCYAAGLNMHNSAETELTRILRPESIEKIRAKQASKPTGSALPTSQSAAHDPDNADDHDEPIMTLAHRLIAQHERTQESVGDACIIVDTNEVRLAWELVNIVERPVPPTDADDAVRLAHSYEADPSYAELRDRLSEAQIRIEQLEGPVGIDAPEADEAVRLAVSISAGPNIADCNCAHCKEKLMLSVALLQARAELERYKQADPGGLMEQSHAWHSVYNALRGSGSWPDDSVGRISTGERDALLTIAALIQRAEKAEAELDRDREEDRKPQTGNDWVHKTEAELERAQGDNAVLFSHLKRFTAIEFVNSGDTGCKVCNMESDRKTGIPLTHAKDCIIIADRPGAAILARLSKSLGRAADLEKNLKQCEAERDGLRRRVDAYEAAKVRRDQELEDDAALSEDWTLKEHIRNLTKDKAKLLAVVDVLLGQRDEARARIAELERAAITDASL